jgi:branched-chain amino acid transport system substrate-binding protein
VPLHRRKFLRQAAGIATLPAVSRIAAVASAFASAPSIAAAPFRIGLLTIKTGPLAQGGIQMEQGIALFLKEKAHTLAGRTVEFISADTGGNPAGAKTKVQQLIERDKVNVILGPLAAFELLAILDYVRDNQTPLISVAAAEDVTQRRANPFVMRTSASSGQGSHVLAHYAATDLGYRRAATIADDFAYGHEQASAFQRVFEEAGGKVVRKLWPPLVTTDYTPYVAQISDVDCVFSGFSGSTPLRFIRACADFGLKAKAQLLCGITALDDPLLRSLGDEAVGVVSASVYDPGFDSPGNRRFVDAMQKEYNVLPGLFSSSMYVAGQCIEAAMEKLDGRADDRVALAEALHQVSLTDTPRGRVTFDHLGNIIGDVFIRRCERTGGRLVNKVMKRFPDVSQFWTYDEEQFLAAPVYARDYPPARNLEP